MKKRLFSLFLTLLLLLSALPAAQAAEGEELTILFTHDLHSHLLPALDERGVSYGGYARLKTVIDDQLAQAAGPAVLVDGGDFSMGSLFQAAYATDAAELRIMGAMGYDVTTFGNHEYDYRAEGFAGMLNAALDSGEPLPQLVEVNYKPPLEGQEGYDAHSAAVWEAFDRYGVRDYTVIERDGWNFAVFGIMGKDSHACAPMSGMVLEDPIEAARRTVAAIEENVPEPRVIICLSHSGTWSDPEDSEDEILAGQVEGIDVIVSGHTHTTLHEPIRVNDTLIVSCGEYSKYLGVVKLTASGDGFSLADYELIPIDSSIPQDPEIAGKVEEYKLLVEKNYLSLFGDLSYDQVIAHNPYQLDSTAELNEHRESDLGNLIADAYRWAVEQAEGDSYIPVDFALTANGVVRASLPTGDITAADAFNVLSLGIGADKVPGYPLVSVYITGKDLKNAFEVDASVTGLMGAAQLYFTGMTFTYNPHRMLFNKVTDCAQVLPDGSTVPIEDDRLYRVVTGLYCGQMLGAVNGQSFGILTITPRDENGQPITDLEAHIVHDPSGAEVKEWYALASYLQSMGTISPQYDGTLGRKISAPSRSPVALLRNANWITMAMLAVILLVVLAVVLAVRLVLRRRKRKKA